MIIENEHTEHANICRVTIESELGAKMMGKMPGHYSTIEAQALRQHNRDIHQEIGGCWPTKSSGLSSRVG